LNFSLMLPEVVGNSNFLGLGTYLSGINLKISIEMASIASAC